MPRQQNETDLEYKRRVICIGDGSALAEERSKIQAIKHNLVYRGILDNSTLLDDGCYHTSIYDITLIELQNKINDDVKLIVLDIDETYYKSVTEYYDTINIGQTLQNTIEVEFINQKMQNPFVQLVNENKTFCIMPFVALYKDGSKSRVCCYMSSPVTTTYTDFNTDPALNKIRTDLLLPNRPIEQCKYCYNLENNNVISPRQTYTINWTYKLNLKSFDDVVRRTTLLDYDIRLTNKCNLLCRSCAPGASHLIGKEYFKIGLTNTNTGLKTVESYDIIDLTTVRRVYVAGGEPTIDTEFFKFLQKCIDLNKLDFEFIINTNAVVTSQKFLNLIKHFTNLKFEISLDGFDEINHYVRWPSNWGKIKTNIIKLNQVSAGRISTNTVVSIYNIGRLYKLFEFLENTYPIAQRHLSILVNPDVQQAYNFPDKKFALDDLEKMKLLRTYQIDATFKSKVDYLITEITNSDINFDLLEKFFKFNDKLDTSRGVKLYDYIPELEACRELTTKQI